MSPLCLFCELAVFCDGKCCLTDLTPMRSLILIACENLATPAVKLIPMEQDRKTVVLFQMSRKIPGRKPQRGGMMSSAADCHHN